MSDIMEGVLVRSGTWGELWLDGERVSECYGCQAKLAKNKEKINRCGTYAAGSKMAGTDGTGSIRIYNATSRLLELEGRAMQAGRDLRHTIITNLADPDNPSNQRIALFGVSFDDLTLADWEAARLGQIEAPFTFESFELLDT